LEHNSDILIMGSGLAGLGYALKVAEFARVNLITKRGLTETSTSKAQGGIAAVLGPDDRFEYHIQDTLTTGEGLSHPDIVELVVRQGPARIRELIDLGAHFDMRTVSKIFSMSLIIADAGKIVGKILPLILL